MSRTSRLLIDESPLQVIPSLAVKIGLNEAIFLQQLHYWTTTSKTDVDGVKWAYNTLAQWQEQFPFFSKSTLERTIASLVKMKVIVVRQLSKNKSNRTNYYCIDYDVLDSIPSPQNDVTMTSKCGHPSPQNDVMDNVKMTSSTMTSKCGHGYTREETTTETTLQQSANALGPMKKPSWSISKLELPEWLDLDSWNGYLTMRSAKKKPINTERTAALIIKKLESYKNRGLDHAAILDQSTLQGWTDVYPIREQVQQKPVEHHHDFSAYLQDQNMRDVTPTFGAIEHD